MKMYVIVLVTTIRLPAAITDNQGALTNLIKHVAADYRKWNMAGPPERYGDVNTWQPPTEPFEGESSFTYDYQAYNDPRTSMKPNEAAKMSNSIVNAGNTGCDFPYIKHLLPPKFIKEKIRYIAQSVCVDDFTTFKRGYQLVMIKQDYHSYEPLQDKGH